MRAITARRGEALVAIGLAALGLAAAAGGARIPLGSPTLPGAGVFPLVLGLLLAVVAAAAAVRARRRGADGDQAVALGTRKVGAALLGLLGIALLFERLGFPICSAVFVGLLARAFGRVPWRTALVAGLISAAAAYLLFVALLDVQLPMGLLEQRGD